MSKKSVLIVASALFFANTPAAIAQESLLEYVVESCALELESYCSTVSPGNGRLLHCVAAHEDKLSGQCEYALYEAATLLEELATAIVYIASECEADIEAYCSDVESGDGRLLSCLAESKEDISASCTAAITGDVAD